MSKREAGWLFLCAIVFLVLSAFAACSNNFPIDEDTTTTTTIYYEQYVLYVTNCSDMIYPDTNQFDISAEWTVINYFVGDNDLGVYYDAYDIPAIRSINGSNRIVFVTLVDKSGKNDRLEVNYYGTNTVFYLTNELTTSDPGELISFVRWAVSISPASKYILVMHNHGAGVWRSGGNVDNGVNKGWEDGSDGYDTLNAYELEYGLSNIVAMTGITGFEIYGADCCNCGSYEITYAASKYANYFIGFESESYTKSWRHDQLYNWFITNTSATTLDLCVRTADLAYVHITNTDAQPGTSDPLYWFTVTVCDLSKVPAFQTALDLLGAAFKNLSTEAQIRAMMQIRYDQIPLEYPSQIDIYQYLTNVKNSSAMPTEVRNFASTAYDKARDMIAYTTGYGEYGSLSLFYPTIEGQVYSLKYLPYNYVGMAQGDWGSMMLDPPYAGDMYEDDDSLGAAKLHNKNCDYYHNLYQDEDWIYFNATGGVAYQIMIDYGIPMNPLEIYDQSGTLLKTIAMPGIVSMGYSMSRLTTYFTPSVAGNYYIRIRGGSSVSIPYPKHSRYIVVISDSY